MCRLLLGIEGCGAMDGKGGGMGKGGLGGVYIRTIGMDCNMKKRL